MKIHKIIVFWVCLALAIFASSAIYGQIHEDPTPSTNKLEEEFLGLHLGCSFDELQEVLKKAPNSITLIKKANMEGMPSYLYSGNHRLQGATATAFGFWDGKLGIVVVYFKTDEAKKVYNALKMKMEEKYGKMNEGIKFGGEKCSLTKAGMLFTLQLEKGLLETDTVSLIAVHLGIIAAKDAKEVEKKAKELGDF